MEKINMAWNIIYHLLPNQSLLLQLMSLAQCRHRLHRLPPNTSFLDMTSSLLVVLSVHLNNQWRTHERFKIKRVAYAGVSSSQEQYYVMPSRERGGGFGSAATEAKQGSGHQVISGCFLFVSVFFQTFYVWGFHPPPKAAISKTTIWSNAQNSSKNEPIFRTGMAAIKNVLGKFQHVVKIIQDN